jgi:argininosuccinate lyase
MDEQPTASPGVQKQWAGRIEGGASRRAEIFGASIGFDRRLWLHDVMGSAAHCRMLAKQGIISADDARQILSGLDQIVAQLFGNSEQPPVAGIWPASTPRELRDVDPAFEDIHTWIETWLRERIGEAAGRLHTARSRNDQVATDLRLYCREALLWEVDLVLMLQRALVELTDRAPNALMPGYTHLQRAQPVLFAHHMLAYVEMFQRDAERLLDCYTRTDVMPLGSGALAGVPYPLDRSETARLLGFAAISRNSLDAVADRDFVVEHLAAVALVGAHLSRLAEELVLWSSAEFGFIEIGDAHSTGSSIMPQKRNPDVAELIRGKTGRLYGHLMAMLTVLKGLPLAYNKDMQEDKEAFFDAVDTAVSCLELMAEMLDGAHPRLDRMAASAGASFSTATDYADYLAKKGVPFREAHHVIGALVRTCELRGCDLADLTLEDLQVASPLFGPDIVGLSAAAVAAARDVPGGTAPSQVTTARGEAGTRLASLEQEVLRRRARLPSLQTLLSAPLE